MSTLGELTQYNIDIFSGDDKHLVITVYDESNALLNISGFTARFVISEIPPGKAAIVTKTTGSGISLTDPTNGEMTITLDGTDTDDLLGRYTYQASITDTSGNRTVVAHGIMDILEDR